MTAPLPNTPAEVGTNATSDRSRTLTVWAVRQAGHDLANMTVGIPGETLVSAAEVSRLLRHHGILTADAAPTAAQPRPPWAVVWPMGQQLMVIPASTVEDAEALRASIRETGGEAVAALVASPADADQITAAARAAADADNSLAARRADVRAALGRLIPPPPPPPSAPAATAAGAGDDGRALGCD